VWSSSVISQSWSYGAAIFLPLSVSQTIKLSVSETIKSVVSFFLSLSVRQLSYLVNFHLKYCFKQYRSIYARFASLVPSHRPGNIVPN
jgi:hypothetical protein